jgi:GTP cyclohydrolase IA
VPEEPGSAAAPARPLPSRAEAEAAVRVLIRWAGDDPDRPDLRETPRRVLDAYGELFAGYRTDPVALLRSASSEAGSGEGLVVLRGVHFVSHCEHHLLPSVGQAHVGYLPRRRIAGIGAIAEVVDAFARRLQIQERMTDQIAHTLDQALEPDGVAVVVEAEHLCMTARGPLKAGSALVTSRMLGAFRSDASLRREFLSTIGLRRGAHASDADPA